MTMLAPITSSTASAASSTQFCQAARSSTMMSAATSRVSGTEAAPAGVGSRAGAWSDTEISRARKYATAEESSTVR
ncbi:MAG TPA: hypothetical protein VMI73_05805 [Trebonia sp.]|nr:hypothetical protein [Trebonia sp.]